MFKKISPPHLQGIPLFALPWRLRQQAALWNVRIILKNIITQKTADPIICKCLVCEALNILFCWILSTILWRCRSECLSLTGVLIMHDSFSSSRCGAKWYVGGTDIEQCGDTGWDYHEEQHSCWSLHSSWCHGQGALWSTIWLDG
jgi:hypothetical protein